MSVYVSIYTMTLRLHLIFCIALGTPCYVIPITVMSYCTVATTVDASLRQSAIIGTWLSERHRLNAVDRSSLYDMLNYIFLKVVAVALFSRELRISQMHKLIIHIKLSPPLLV